jgi:uncharacterized membrane protein
MANELTSFDPETPEPEKGLGELLKPDPIRFGKIQDAGADLLSLEMLYKGPIPPPAMLKQFDEISPGLALKIIENSFEQSRHRREIEKHVIEKNTESRKLGMFIGGGLGFTALVGAVITAVMGQPWVAGILVGAVTGGLVTSFFGSFNRQKAETKTKAARKERITPGAKAKSSKSPETPSAPAGS